MTGSIEALADPREIRKAFGGFVTGVTVVTALDADKQPRGLTANSFTSVSLNPPLVLVCIDEKASSHPVFKASQAFGVSVLGSAQRATSNLFASKAPNKFEQTPTFVRETGAPLVHGAVSWFDCRTHSVTQVGDHLILVGRVVAFGHDAGAPLGYCRGNYIDFGLEQEAVGRGSNLVLSCIAEMNGALLLELDPASGKWSIPMVHASHAGSRGVSGLTAALRAAGAEVELSFLYSVYEDKGETMIVYRGTVAAVDASAAGSRQTRLFEQADVPWDDIATSQIRTMLKRYLIERENDRFGIYVDSAEGGSVAMLDGSPTPWEQHARSLQ
jgi:flavin-dependent trigonelline monooxygenase, reductase component